MHLFDHMPLDVSGGTDFLTGLPQQEVREASPAGGVEVRREKIVVTDKLFAYGDPPPPPGRVAFCERSIVALGELVGMVRRSALDTERRIVQELARERDDLSARNAALLREVEALRGSTDPRAIYVTPDGAEHASKGAAQAHMNRKAVTA